MSLGSILDTQLSDWLAYITFSGIGIYLTGNCIGMSWLLELSTAGSLVEY